MSRGGFTSNGIILVSGGGGGGVITFNKHVDVTTSAATINIDPAANPNDVLIAVGITDAGIAVNWTWPASFVELTAQHVSNVDGANLGVSRKLAATGSEGSLAITNDGASTIIGLIASFGGVNNTTPEDVTPVYAFTDSSLTSPWQQSASITPVTNGSMIVAIMVSDEQASGDVVHSFATTAGTTGAWTVQADVTSGTTRNFALATATQAVAGPITVQGTGTLSGVAATMLFLIALRPA